MEYNLEDFVKSLEQNRRLLAIDYGSKKLGIALSDISLTIASPLTIINRINLSKDIDAIMRLIKEHQIVGLVFGFPITMDGIEKQACQDVRLFTTKFLTKHQIPIYFQDERLSTRAATRVLIESNINRKKRDLIDDKIAACFILQGALDKINYYKNKHDPINNISNLN
jgi:putative Holliday junction resolvase